jgi:DNA-binding beta-propeller fold protein YncE
MAGVADADITTGHFPLGEGNEWTYRADDGSADLEVRIDRTTTYQGDEYYLMRGYNGNAHWVKQPTLGTVTSNVANRWYRFNAQAGERWTFQVNGDSVSGSNGSTLRISARRQRVRTPAGIYECLRIHWDHGANGITDEWFAPGIGLVQRRELRNGRQVDLELVRAVISGNVVVDVAPTPTTPASTNRGPFGISGHVPASRVTSRTLLGQALTYPTDLAFHPDGSLWITDRERDSVVVIFDAGSSSMRGNLFRDDSDHFNNNPMALAFSSARQEFATALDNRNDYNGGAAPNNFMGPTLWPTTHSEFTGASDSHLDMLHHSPNAVGIAAGAPWQGGGADPREYWVFNGDAGSIDRYFFREPHVPGGHDHSDGLTFRYGSGLSRVPAVPGHLALDAQSGMLYIADTGNGRIATLDTSATTFSNASRIRGHHDETPLYLMGGARIETLTRSGLTQPAGLILHEGKIIVSDHATGRIHVFGLDGRSEGSLDTGLGAGAVMGLAVAPNGKLALVDAAQGRVLELTVRR